MDSKMRFLALALSAVVGASGLVGCVQMPTEKQNVVSLKPQISFRLGNDNVGAAQVNLDGMPVGVAGQFQAGRTALQVEPGTHQLLVQLNGNVLLNEKFYVGDGVTRTFELR